MISNQGQFQISSEKALKLTRKGFDSLSRGILHSVKIESKLVLKMEDQIIRLGRWWNMLSGV